MVTWILTWNDSNGRNVRGYSSKERLHEGLIENGLDTGPVPLNIDVVWIDS